VRRFDASRGSGAGLQREQETVEARRSNRRGYVVDQPRDEDLEVLHGMGAS
jgi:hypothetical protein